MLDITAVICTYNSENNISKCVESLKANNVKEIIIVDGNSLDKTVELIKDKVNKIIYDKKTGLADARNLGITESKCKYVLNAGSDNYFPKNSINELLTFYEEHNYKGVSMLTKVDFTNNRYLAYSMNSYRKIRFKPGLASVIGTPTLFESKILKENPYLSTATHSDDEELCTRLKKRYDFNFAISNIYCHESSSDYFSEIYDKWKRYGISDFEIFSRNKENWTLARKIKSLLYPLKSELLMPISSSYKSIVLLPFLVCITLIRYYFWICCSFKSLTK
jgi:glycosyltransferase involved in cell wall biosynthesis